MEQQKTHQLKALAGTIAHEMRNPIGQAQTLLSYIEKLLPTVDQLKATYQHIETSQRVLKKGLQLITIILNEINDKPIDDDTFQLLSVKQVTHSAILDYSYQDAEEKERILVQGEDFFFKGEETLYTYILFNLIKNALFYLPAYPDMTITIKIQPGKNYNTVQVHDNGPGIPKNALPTLFDDFFTSEKISGTGLGLSYCKRVMQAFGGDITCDSVKGQHTAFNLYFPIP